MEIHYCTQRSAKEETTRLDDVVTKEKGLQLAKSDARLQEAWVKLASLIHMIFARSHRRPSSGLRERDHILENVQTMSWIDGSDRRYSFFCGFKFHSSLSTVWRVYSFKFLFYELSAVADEELFSGAIFPLYENDRLLLWSNNHYSEVSISIVPSHSRRERNIKCRRSHEEDKQQEPRRNVNISWSLIDMA